MNNYKNNNILLSSLDSRSRKIFQYIVESYLETGNPVGSNTLSKKISPSLASATIRSVMSNLEGLNLNYLNPTLNFSQKNIHLKKSFK